MEFVFRRNVLIVLPINTPGVSQIVNNQPMSLFHQVTMPMAFQLVEWTSHRNGVLCCFRQGGWGGGYSTHLQAIPRQTHPRVVVVQNSFPGLACSTWPKPYCRIPTFSEDRGHWGNLPELAAPAVLVLLHTKYCKYQKKDNSARSYKLEWVTSISRAAQKQSNK